jgi:O-antigen/teichoic acid export membrane protein
VSRVTARTTFVTALDQLVSSGSNFVIGVLVGSLAGPRSFGAYMIAFTAWLVVVGSHRALLTEPLVITRGDPTETAALGHGVVGELVLGAGFGAFTALLGLVFLGAGGGDTGRALLMLAPLLPGLLLQDYWRAMAFASHTPGRALVNDSAFVVAQVAALIVVVLAGGRSAPWFVLAWGIGAGVGAAVGFAQFRQTRADIDLASGPRLLRSLWSISRWQLADFSTSFSADQLYLFVVVATLGETRYGGLKAALSLMGPANVMLLSGGAIGFPGAARALRQGGLPELVRFSRKLTVAVTMAVVANAALVFIVGPWALANVYRKADFRQFGYLTRYVSVQYAVSIVSFGAGIALRVARQTRRLWFARVGVTVASLAAVLVLSKSFGLRGAAWAGVLTGALNAAAIIAVYRYYLRDVARGRAVDPASGVQGATVTDSVVILP